MALKFFSRDHARTPFVKLDTRKCKACWRCIDECSNQVIGKVDLPWHKHALLVDSDKCNGCLTCIETCNFQAFSGNEKQPVISSDKRLYRAFIINNLLLISGIVMIISGLILQFGFHIGGGDRADRHLADTQTIRYEQMRSIDQNKTIWNFHYYDWSTIHKVSIVLFFLLMAYHTYAHWKWYKGVLSKRLFSKNLQILTLSLIFMLVAITGIVPWLIGLSGGTSILRLLFIEIHDKLALIFLIYLVLHIAKRSRWYSATYLRIK